MITFSLMLRSCYRYLNRFPCSRFSLNPSPTGLQRVHKYFDNVVWSVVVRNYSQSERGIFPVYYYSFNGYSTLANQRLAKMLSTVFGAIKNGNVPTSISELLTARNYNLRGDAILKLPKVNSTKYEIKSWRYQAARLWKTFSESS